MQASTPLTRVANLVLRFSVGVWALALAEHVFHGLLPTGISAISVKPLLLEPLSDIVKAVERCSTRLEEGRRLAACPHLALRFGLYANQCGKCFAGISLWLA
jgi:hypothetical protein